MSDNNPQFFRPALTNSDLIGSEIQATPLNIILDPKQIVANVLSDSLKRIQQQYPNKFDFLIMTTYPKSVQQIDKDPRNINQMPRVLFTVTRVSMPETHRFIGNLLASTYTADDMNMSVTTRGNLQSDVIEIALWTLDPIIRDKMTVLVRQILFEQQDVLYSQWGFIKFIRTGGADDEVDVGKLPRTIYRSKATYLCTIKITQTILDDIIADIVNTPILATPTTPPAPISQIEILAAPVVPPPDQAEIVEFIEEGVSFESGETQSDAIIAEENTATPEF